MDAGRGVADPTPHLRDDAIGEERCLSPVLGFAQVLDRGSLHADDGQNAHREDEDRDEGLQEHHAGLLAACTDTIHMPVSYQVHRRASPGGALGSHIRIVPDSDTTMRSGRGASVDTDDVKSSDVMFSEPSAFPVGPPMASKVTA